MLYLLVYSLWIWVKEDQEELQKNIGRRWWRMSHYLNQSKIFLTIHLGQDKRGSSKISTPSLSSSSTTILMYNQLKSYNMALHLCMHQFTHAPYKCVLIKQITHAWVVVDLYSYTYYIFIVKKCWPYASHVVCLIYQKPIYCVCFFLPFSIVWEVSVINILLSSNTESLFNSIVRIVSKQHLKGFFSLFLKQKKKLLFNLRFVMFI